MPFIGGGQEGKSSFKEFSSKSSFVPGKAQERVWIGKVVVGDDGGDGQGNIEIQLIIIIITTITNLPYKLITIALNQLRFVLVGMVVSPMRLDEGWFVMV